MEEEEADRYLGHAGGDQYSIEHFADPEYLDTERDVVKRNIPDVLVEGNLYSYPDIASQKLVANPIGLGMEGILTLA